MLRSGIFKGSIGSVGDTLNTALIDPTIRLVKTEVIEYERPVQEGRRQVERATTSWVHWYNTECLHSGIEDIPPVEHDEFYYDRTEGSACLLFLNTSPSDKPRPIYGYGAPQDAWLHLCEVIARKQEATGIGSIGRRT